MENPYKIIFFGDSITKGYTPKLEKKLRSEYPEIELISINAGVSGETTRDGLQRLQQLLDEESRVVVIGFGMNDWRKGVSKEEFKKNLNLIVNKFRKNNVRIILTTINPSYEKSSIRYDKETDEYNKIIKEIASDKRIEIADVNAYWKKNIFLIKRGLRDAIHPNQIGNDLICDVLIHVISREHTTILWQYNGREAKCNYKCPYCYYTKMWSSSDQFFGTIDQWHKSFKENFRKQKIVFYLAFGEPTIGNRFFDIVEMIGKEPDWSLRITSNISGLLEKLVETKLANDKRLFINASFHPFSITREKFLDRLLFLREHGIEVPIVYVAYPPFLKYLKQDILFFSEHGFIVHLRRFQGIYKNKVYPKAYTDSQRRFIAKFMDDGSIKYLLNNQISTGDISFSGYDFFIIDNVGNVGYDSNIFAPYTKYRCILGNIHQNNFRPLTNPGPYPGIREGTVDGVANLIHTNYRELKDNNIISFVTQGGIIQKGEKITYNNYHTDFQNSKVRAMYNFPHRNITDKYYLWKYIGIERLKKNFKMVFDGRLFFFLKRLQHKTVNMLKH